MPSRSKYTSYQFALTYSYHDRERDLANEPLAPIELRVAWGRYDEPEHSGCTVYLFHEQNIEPDPLPTPHDTLMNLATKLGDRVRRTQGRAAS